MSEDKKPRTGADLRLDSAAKAAIVNALAEKMKLRQWCIEQSVRACDETLTANDMKELTKFFYEFVITTTEEPNE